MKRVAAVLAVGVILAVGVAAYARGGGYMMGPGYGGHMTGWGNSGTAFDRKFLDETADLRKELHMKRFEYAEAIRDPDSSSKTITRLEKEIGELQDKIHDTSPRRAYRFGGMRGIGCW